MAASKHAPKKANNARTTIMTQRGVTDASLLKADDLAIHNRRLSGPGTRSKNPNKFDRNAPKGAQ